MDEKLICCQVCQVFFRQCQRLLSTKSICNMAPPPTETSQTKSLCSDGVGCPPSFCPCYWGDFIIGEKFRDQTPKGSTFFGGFLLSGVVQREREYSGWRQRKATLEAEQRKCLFSPGRREARNFVTLCKCVAASSLAWMQTSCVLFQRLPYLPIPCYAVHVCRSNQANCIASGWVDQKDLHSLFALSPLSCSNLRKREELKHRSPPEPAFSFLDW